MTDDRHHDDDLDRRLRSAAHAARASADASTHDADVDQALADVTAGRSVTQLGSPSRITDRRWIALVGAAAAVVLLVGGIAIWGRDGGTVTSPTPTAPPVAATDPTTTSTSTTTTEPSDEEPVAAPEPAATTTTTSIAETTVRPDDNEPGADEEPLLVELPEIVPLLGDVAWEHAGISRACPTGNDEGRAACTEVAVDPSGVVISYDATTGTLTRHARHDGSLVTGVLPAELAHDASLLAAGPDDVAYLLTPSEHIEASDIIAVSVAPTDAGRVIERFEGALPIGDIDVYVAPEGLVTTGFYESGPRPRPGADILIEWVDRDPTEAVPAPGDDPAFHGLERVWFDDDAGTIGVGDRVWPLDERVVEPVRPSSWGRVVATFDGGFLAAYHQASDAPQVELMRGYADGTVEHWVFPGSFAGPGPVLEPMGTFLVPDRDSFVRVAPFADRPTGWDGRLDVDLDTLTVDVTELNEYLASLDWSADQPPWDLGPIAFARAAIGGPLDPAELQTIWIDRVDDDGVHVVATTEGFLDDSVYGVRWNLVIASTLDRVASVSWSQTCQPNRGHQTYVAELCT